MNQTRLNVRIEGVMADHVDGLIDKKLYNSQSEYVRDLIRHDMEHSDIEDLRRIVRNGFSQLGAGNFTEATPDSHEAIYERAMARIQNEPV